MCKVLDHKGEFDIERLPMDSEEQRFNGWIVKYKKSHILQSICTSKETCSLGDKLCPLCFYMKSLDLPHLPEMVFANNLLTVIHPNGAKIEFNALDALKTVCNGKLPIQVASSAVWRESRLPEHLEEKIKPFDWTFSCNYKGTLTGPLKIEATDERIDFEKLKQQEKILFYHESMLYEDELHDNGISSCTVKIRVMPSSFFVLLRFFLRVDNVMLRINDTRYFHEFETNYILREFTNKECAFKDVHLPLTMFGDPNALSPCMPLRTSEYEKITFDIPDQDVVASPSSNHVSDPDAATSEPVSKTESSSSSD